MAFCFLEYLYSFKRYSRFCSKSDDVISGSVTPRNVILTQNVITIAAKCNANGNVIISTHKVIKLSTRNVITFQPKM